MKLQNLIILFIALPKLFFGQFSLSLKVKNLPANVSNKIFFECFEKDKWANTPTSLATLELSSENKLTIPFSPQHNGQYRIRFSGPGKCWTDFWIDLKELPKTTILDIDYTQLKGLPSMLHTSETQYLYKKLGAAYAKTQWSYDSLKSITNSNFIEAQNRFNAGLKELTSDCNANPTCKSIFAPLFERNTFKPLQSKQDTSNYLNLFLNEIDFSQTEILFHFAAIRSLNQYLNELKYLRKENYMTYYVDQVVGRLAENKEVNQFIHSFILDKILDFKDEKALNYYLNNYIEGCADHSLSNNTQSLIESLKACEPGKKVIELKYPNSSGQNISLESVFRKNKITLLLFWRSNCSHCEEFHPMLQNIYTKYKPLGLEVYAISIDKNIDDWKNHLIAKPAPWINVFAPLKDRNTLAKNFPSPSTPTLIALDNKGRVISRLIVRSNLENFLEENKSYFK
ncbi:MAG: TlpA family protein disulfide reductase [Bacteroidota bacterium]